MAQTTLGSHRQTRLNDYNKRAEAVLNNQGTTWAAATTADTEKHINVAPPSALPPSGKYLISVHNPSTQSDLTVVVKGAELMTTAAVSKYPELTRFGVTKATDKQVIVQGWLVGGDTASTANGGRITLSNDTVLTSVGAFESFISARKI